jgi:probable addiction module antidote protein
MRDRPHDDAMADLYRDDPKLAAQMLSDLLEEGDQAELLIALRQMTKSFGGIPKVAEQAELNPTQLYRTLSAAGNPTVSSLCSVLKAMGLRLAVEPIAGQGR